MTAPEDTSRLRKALTVAAAVTAGLVLTVGLAKCSSPSTIHTGDAAGSGTDPLNAAGAGLGVVARWADGPADLVALRWLDADTAVVTARLHGGEHVTVTAQRSAHGWAVPAPPSPAPAPRGPDWAMLPVEKLAEARDDPRWDVTRGFLDAWLARQSTERWTAVGFDAPSPSVEYDSWQFTGVSGPAPVPGTGIEVVPVDFEATAKGATRNYRAFVAVVADPTGRWTVNAVGHRRPS